MTNTPFEHVLIEELIPFIDANIRSLADQPIALAYLDRFAHIGMFSGGSIAPSEIKDMAA
jgi:hypothetical protein